MSDLDTLRAFEREVLERAARVCDEWAASVKPEFDVDIDQIVAVEHRAAAIRALPPLPDEELRKWARRMRQS
jgi:hypothetical protein